MWKTCGSNEITRPWTQHRTAIRPGATVSLAVSSSTDLFLVHLQRISIGHLEGFWAITWVDARTIEEKSNRGGCFSLTLAEGVHELREGGGALDLEEDLVVVVRDLDVQVLALGLIVGVAAGTRRLITVRHGVDAGIVLCCIVVDGGESVGGRRGSCERRVQGFCCHQVLI